MSTNLNYTQVTNVKRRTWDIEAYEKRAEARRQKKEQDKQNPTTRKDKAGDDTNATSNHEKEEFVPAEKNSIGPIGSKRAFLKPRTNKVSDIDSKVGSTELISSEAAAITSLKKKDDSDSDEEDTLSKKKQSQVVLTNENVISKKGVGWYCKVCDCFLKDSLTYLDHINGRKHQRALGYSMRVERSTKEQLKDRLSKLKKEKEVQEEMNAIKKKKQQELLLQASSNTKDNNKKNNNPYEQVVIQKDEELLKQQEEKRKKRKEERKKKKQQKQQQLPEEEQEGEDQDGEIVEEQMDPALAAMMGFSGFGGGNKNR